MTPLQSISAEEDRIREAYARRLQRTSRDSGCPPGRLFQLHQRERQVLQVLERNAFLPLRHKKILEVGCGTGAWLRDFIRWGAQPKNLHGIDLLPDAVAEARRLCPVEVRIECGSASDLGLEAETYDLVLQSTVFTSVLDVAVKRKIALEMLRVAKYDGLILWYDFHVNNPHNRDVRGVGKKEIRELFPDCAISLRRISLAPPLARWLAPRSWFACYLLSAVPLLCTHYLGVIRKVSPTS